MSFEERIAARSADVHADFLAPHLAADAVLLDCGSGAGTIALGLSAWLPRGRVVAADRDRGAPREAQAHAARTGIGNLAFVACDAARLPFPDNHFDVVFSHSMLETLEHPLDALGEMRRVLRPGGTVAVASVEYSGLILSGPRSDRLERFYAVRERLWELLDIAEPRMGRTLRRLLGAAGFEAVHASAKFIATGTQQEVRRFGRGRADDCRERWFGAGAQRHGLLTADELEEIRAAWLEFADSPDAFAAFPWCRAVGVKPA